MFFLFHRSKQPQICSWRARCFMYLSCWIQRRSDSIWHSKESSSPCKNGGPSARATFVSWEPGFKSASAPWTCLTFLMLQPQPTSGPCWPPACASAPDLCLWTPLPVHVATPPQWHSARIVRYFYLCWVDVCIGLLFNRGNKTSQLTDWFIIK